MQTTDVVDVRISIEIFFCLSHTCLHKTTIMCCY